MAEHLVEWRSLDESSDEVAMRRSDRIFGAQIDGGADGCCFLADRSVVVAGELALLEEHAGSLLEGAALEHGGVQLPQLFIGD